MTSGDKYKKNLFPFVGYMEPCVSEVRHHQSKWKEIGSSAYHNYWAKFHFALKDLLS
jgi:hypothetical protein